MPARARAQILRKLERLEAGLHGDIKRLHEAEATYRLRMGDYRILFDVEGDVMVIRESVVAKTLMTKAVAQTVVCSISRKREQIATLREELEDLNDYLDLTEARVRDED